MYLPMASSAKIKRPSFNSSSLWNSLQAWWHLWSGKKEEATRFWVDLLKKDPETPNLKVIRYLLEAQDFQQAKEHLEGFENEPCNSSGEIFCLLSRCYLAQGLISEAKDKVVKAIQAQPQNADYWGLLADCHLELGDWREAIKALDNSLRAAPKNANTNYRLGSIYAFHEEYQEALRCFQGCCQLKPRDSLFWEMKAEMHLRLEQITDATISFDKALRFGGNPDIAARLAYCYIQNNQITKGIYYYEFALKYEPDHYDALSNLAAVYQNNSRSNDALKLLEHARTIYANDPILLNNLAYTMVHLGRTRKATEYYYEALRMAPAHPLILYNLSVCLAQKGNWQEGIDNLNQLLEIDPSHVGGWTLLASIYDQMEVPDVAIDCYNKALKLA